ncbi:hypothetical protein [Streptacidiphilus sp. EB129]|uniref:hypothetical protein n=1 Tax=Streptacidiphilus sp. EB129 TaxID=3156262 RepID=UPI0035179A09
MGDGHGFPGLGFDPAPGNLAEVTSLAAALRGARNQLAEADAMVRQAASGGREWSGEAAEAFAHRVGELPRHLDTAQQSFGAVAALLEGWQSQLAGMKTQARSLEAQAVAARTGCEQARDNPDLELAGQTFAAGAELRQAEQRYQAAVTTLNAAETDLRGFVDQATRLLTQHRELAETAAGAVERAAQSAPPGPGFFARILDGLEAAVRDQIKLADAVLNWVKDHANAIAAVGDMLGTASTVIGIVGVVLDCTPLAPAGAVLDAVSGGLSVAALGTHLIARAAGAPVSGTTLAEDAMGSVSFGVSRAVGAAGRAAEAGAAVPRVVSAVARGETLSTALGAAGTAMSVKDAKDDPSGLGYLLPKNGRQGAEEGVNPATPFPGVLAVGFENAWNAGSAKDRAAVPSRAGAH